MNSTILDPFAGLFFMVLFLYVLYWVVRAAVGAAIRGSLREDLLSPSAADLVRDRDSDTTT